MFQLMYSSVSFRLVLFHTPSLRFHIRTSRTVDDIRALSAKGLTFLIRVLLINGCAVSLALRTLLVRQRFDVTFLRNVRV